MTCPHCGAEMRQCSWCGKPLETASDRASATADTHAGGPRNGADDAAVTTYKPRIAASDGEETSELETGALSPGFADIADLGSDEELTVGPVVQRSSPATGRSLTGTGGNLRS